ncbi:cell division and transport-associated protein TolA [Luteibacter rhizovicinus]|uniref:Cell division and transport-associated protein TolA n=1 Tax=Luteibacter rhizovicinus TaxID=242606 RepID=A0A4R3YNM4_9GAMM|nr:cell envelope integrity protein TolA [Luteibacter rhizovicinus]TCV93931.1 cell division and transport-associated protein TolA [Luteibacter rhizovicinus]
MANRKETSRAVVLAALLHLGIVAFLAFAIIPCSTYEEYAERLGVPADWNPMKCPAPLELPGQIIEATLVGPTGSPPPKATKVKPTPDTTPPPQVIPAPTPPQPVKPPVPTLPPPPKQPDVKDQEKVVDDALQKAEDAKKLQEEKQRQQQAEIDAQNEKKKQEKQKEIDEIFKQLDAAKAQTKKADSTKKQAEQQLKDLQNAKDDGLPDLPAAAQKQTGTNGKDSGKLGLYIAAIQNAVTANYTRPDDMPNVPCQVHVIQIPGGQVTSVKVDASCPYNASQRTYVENAVLRAQPLPYAGFEDVYQRDITFTFRP